VASRIAGGIEPSAKIISPSTYHAPARKGHFCGTLDATRAALCETRRAGVSERGSSRYRSRELASFL
jgi:hypothetical protein